MWLVKATESTEATKSTKSTEATKTNKTAVSGAQNHVAIPLSWCFAKFPLPLQRQVVKNAFSWGLHFSAYAFAQEKLLTMVKNAFSWGSNSKILISISN